MWHPSDEEKVKPQTSTFKVPNIFSSYTRGKPFGLGDFSAFSFSKNAFLVWILEGSLLDFLSRRACCTTIKPVIVAIMDSPGKVWNSCWFIKTVCSSGRIVSWQGRLLSCGRVPFSHSCPGLNVQLMGARSLSFDKRWRILSGRCCRGNYEKTHVPSISYQKFHINFILNGHFDPDDVSNSPVFSTHNLQSKLKCRSWNGMWN